uniref:Tetratricopeptide repeat protein n=1 Tax=Panagrolaimus superbus TaxID=310955 RepID=A0A914Y3E9_9BILA
MHPNSLIMLYNYAIVLCLQDIPTEECIKALDAFLAIAPKDHRYVPACYYRKAHYFLSKKDIYQFVSTFEEGLAAEKLQLICYLPYNYPEKYLLEKAFLHYKPQLQNDKNVAGISEG